MTGPTQPTKTCFVMMPISDGDGYDVGHFDRVYNHLIKPACEAAGFVPFRADDATKTNYIVIDVLRRILDAPVAICDLSGRNPNVMYELGIRQALNKPVVFMKDLRTEKIFDIKGLRYAEYDGTLRVDAVLRDRERLTSFLRNTDAGNDVNSVIQLLGVRPAEVTKDVPLSNESSVILSAVEDLGRRLLLMERSLRPNPRVRRRLKLPSGESVEVGETLYAPPGNEIGNLADDTPDGIIIKTRGVDFVSIRSDSETYSQLTTIPF
jgi:hypothetical protein